MAQNTVVLVAIALGEDGSGWLRDLDESGTPSGPIAAVADLAGVVAAREVVDKPRWVWASTAGVYPRLLRQGVRIGRCHDLELTEALLLGYDGRWGEPRALAALWARREGLPVPPDHGAATGMPGQDALFDDLPAPEVLRSAGDPVDAVVLAYADQMARIARTEQPSRFRLLAAVETAGALAASHHEDGLAPGLGVRRAAVASR